MKIKIMTVGLLAVLAGCGGNGGAGGEQTAADKEISAYDGPAGMVKAVVTNSKSFNPNISHGLIDQYKVTITGEGIENPIVATFGGNETSGVVDNVPAGGNRKIKVEAINPNEQKIREGDLENVEILSGGITEVEVSMDSVPVFANLADGAVMPNTRLVARVFSDPADSVTVEDDFNGANFSLSGVLASASSGLSAVAPPLMQEGQHKFTVKSLKTGRSTTVSVRLVDGTKQRPAPISNAGSNAPAKAGVATKY